MGNDVDDALALAMFYRYADEGKSDLLGIVVNKNEPMAVEGYRYFTGHTRGTITIDESGLSRFVPSPDGNHVVLRVASESRHVFLRHLVDLTVSHTSKKN